MALVYELDGGGTFDLISTLTRYTPWGGGEADAYTNLMEKGQLPAFVNHNPRFEVDLRAVPSGTIALTAVALEYLDD